MSSTRKLNVILDRILEKNWISTFSSFVIDGKVIIGMPGENTNILYILRR